MSERIKKYFTGDLNATGIFVGNSAINEIGILSDSFYFPVIIFATVRSNPEFPGNEKNLLRAVIERITRETYAAPIGYYKVDEGIDSCL